MGVQSRAVTCRSHTSKQYRAGADIGLLEATHSASCGVPHSKRHCESPGTGLTLLQVHFPDGGRGQLQPGSCWSLVLAQQQRNPHLEDQPIQRPSAPWVHPTHRSLALASNPSSGLKVQGGNTAHLDSILLNKMHKRKLAHPSDSSKRSILT